MHSSAGATFILQLLEGPPAAIEAAYRRIVRDDRHLEIQLLLTSEVENRLFPNWDMLDDPAQSWLWSPAEVEAGQVERASSAALIAAFTRIADETTAMSDSLVDASGARPAI